MFCPNCGSPNPDTAVHCGSCGAQLGQTAAASAVHPPAPASHPSLPVGTVPNHMGLAIAGLVVNLLGCCLPIFGVVALVYASQVNGKLAAGDLAGAQAASNGAKLWSLISLAVGGAFFTISIVTNVVSQLAASGGY